MTYNVSRTSRLAFAAATALLAVAPAMAQDKPLTGLWFVGGAVGEGQSAYAGALQSLPGATLGHGLALRGAAGAGRYKYDAGTTRITGNYQAAQAALVHQSSGSWGWANFSAGAKYAHTKLTPNDPFNKLAGNRWDLQLQTDGAFDGATWRLGWYGGYGVSGKDYQAMLNLGRQVGSSRYRIGIEGGVMGDPTYTQGTAGGFVGIALDGGLNLQVSAGASEQAGRGAKPYASIGLSRLF